MPEKSSIGFSGFEKLTLFVEISKIPKILEKIQIHRGRRSCSTSYPSGNQVDGSPLVAIILNRIELAQQAPANIREFCHRVCVSDDLLYYGY